MLTILKKFGLNINDIRKRNNELMGKNLLSKLTKDEKKYLDFRKGPPKIMNRDGLFGYMDLSNYLVYPEVFGEINIKNLREYISMFNIKQPRNRIQIEYINDDLTNILTQITHHRIENVQKYLKIEDNIFKKGLNATDIIFRTQSTPFNENIIRNATSWSLVPIDWFCGDDSCQLYVTKIPKTLKVFYLESEKYDKNMQTFNETDFYEFEFLLPRNLLFKEIKTQILTLPPRDPLSKHYFSKNLKMTIHYIKIIKQDKQQPYPQIKKIKLVLS